MKEMKEGSLKHDGAVSVDGVHQKVNGKNLYDFTLHYFDVLESRALLVSPSFIRHPSFYR